MSYILVQKAPLSRGRFECGADQKEERPLILAEHRLGLASSEDGLFLSIGL